MKQNKSNTARFYWLLALVGLTTLLFWPSLAAAAPLTPQHHLERAWRFAAEIGRFNYRTRVAQTIHPTSRLENAGRQASEQYLVAEGMVDRPSQTMAMHLRGDGVGTSGLEIRVEAGRAFGRVDGDEEWQEIPNPSDIFAPGGDPLGFLSAADNVQVADGQATEVRDVEDLSPYPQLPRAFTRYTFDINGRRYAEHIRQQLNNNLRQQGQLPPGVTLGLVREYVDMQGQGEIWINEVGLPVHQLIHLEFPPKRGELNWLEADISTDFFGWDVADQRELLLVRLRQNPAQLITDSLSRLPGQIPNAEELQQFGFALGVTLLVTALLAVGMTYRHSRRFYAGISTAVITLMLVTPLLQANQLHAYSSRQQEKQADFEARQQTQQPIEAVQAELSGASFDPTVDPLTDTDSGQTTTPDYLQIDGPAGDDAASLPALQPTCLITTPGLDCDGDGLLNEVEIVKLGTDPALIDTDGDLISDKTEVQGFNDGQAWYLDPFSIDSNGDGLSDGSECPLLIDIDQNGDLTTPAGSTCTNTDSDSTPDPFDFDNDNDGVPDAVDSNPSYYGNLTTSSQDHLNLDLSGYATDQPIFVEFQLRPTNAKQLWYTNNVLDWPSNDTEGQVTRVHDTTFFDTGSYDLDIAKIDNGDLMLTPLLEIRMAAPNSNGGNPSGGLPITSTFTGSITNQTDLSAWLDQAKLDEHGIRVSQDEASGQIYSYVPLGFVNDTVADTPVAWSAQMVYRPESDVWGQAHEVRLVWMVTALIDNCVTSDMPATFSYTDGKGNPQTISRDDDAAYEIWCQDRANWDTSSDIIQAYYENFHLTGLTTRQESGVKSALIAQTDAASVSYPGYLWHLMNGLQNTFVPGHLVDSDNNGSGDYRFDIAEIKRRFGDNTFSDGAPELWGIPNNKLTILTDDAPDRPTNVKNLVETQIPAFLSSTYGSPSGTQVSLLMVREERFKALNLAFSNAITIQGASISADLGSVDEEVYGSVNWAPYEHDGFGWVSVDLIDYLETLETNLGTDLTNADLQAILGSEPLALEDTDVVRGGAVSLAKNFYLAIHTGLASVVEISGAPIYQTVVDDALFNLGGQKPVVLLVSELVQSIQAIFQAQSAVTIDGELLANNLNSTIIERHDILITIGALELELEGQHEIAAGKGGITVGKVAYKQLYQRLHQVESLSNFHTKLGAYGGGALAIASVGTLFLSEARGISKEDAYLISASLRSAGATLTLYGAVSAYKAYSAAANGVFASERLAAAEAAKMTKTGAIIGAVIGVSIVVGLMIYQTIEQGIKFGSLEFSQLLARTIAQVIVIILLAVLSATIVGAIVVAVLSIIDAVIAQICHLTGWDKDEDLNRWVCGGITGAFAEALTYLIFDQYTVVDLQHKNRLDIAFYEPTIIPSSGVEGYVVGNQFYTSALITSTLRLNKPTGIGSGVNYMLDALGLNDLREVMRQSTFTYTLQANDTNHHSGLSLNQLNWSGNDETFDISGSGLLTTTGINKGPNFYLTESFNTPVLECWGFIVQKCKIRSLKDSFHTSLEESFLFDILPKNITGFTGLSLVADGSYRLNWDSQFPVQQDADGDGLRSRAAGGPDPDDSQWDSDGDGLSDFWELDNDYDPGDFDPDQDGLSDYWERFYWTNPFIADSDYDGLLDGAEFFHSGTPNPYQADNSTWTGGWDIVYAYDGSDQPLNSHVSSDPLAYDSEDDGISDYLEFVYGYNPDVPSKLNVLSLDTAVTAPWQAGDVGYVGTGGTLPYTATVKNELDNRTANGLLEAEFPVDVVQETQVFAALGPQQETTLSGSVTVPAVGQTQAQSITLRAGAVIEAPVPPDASGLVYHNPLDTGPMAFAYGIQGVAVYGIDQSFYYPTPRFGMTDNDDAFSLSIWVKPRVGPSDFPGYDVDIVNLNNSSTGYLDITSSSQYTVTIRGRLDCPNIKLGQFFTNADVDQWRHLALIYDGVGTYRVYRNGALVNSTPSTCTPNLSDIWEVIVGSYSDSEIYGFPGDIDEIRAYNRALSVDEVEALFKNTIRSLDLPVDEPPGQSSFADVSPNVLDVTCSGNTCPDSGLPGLSNQSLRFDGNDDFVTIGASSAELGLTDTSNAGYGKGSFTAMAWVKPDDLSQTRSIIQARNGVSSNFLDMGINNLGQAYLVRNSFGNFLTSTTVLPTDTWTHLAWQYHLNRGSGTWDQVLYVNGQEEARRSGQAMLDVDVPVYLGKANTHGQAYSGLLDDVMIVRASLSEAEIQAIMQETPLLNLHLDEGLAEIGQTASSTFIDSSPNSNDAACTDNCPSAGTKGKIREAPVFDGDDLLTVNPGSELNLNQFSISLWVKPTQVKNGVQWLLKKYASGTGATNYRLWTLNNSLQFKFDVDVNCTGGVGIRHVQSNGSLVQDQWNHILVTYDGQIQKIYLNGSLDKKEDWLSVANPCNSGTNFDMGQNFDGGLDEVMIYGTVLNSLEVADLYEYQAAWYDDTLSQQVVIDVDDPVLSVDLFDDYLPNAPTQIAISARDVSSAIDRIEMLVTPPVGGVYSDSIDPAAATYYFTPAGEGQYTLQLTGWDVVGNSASSAAKTVYVDDTPPSATLAASLIGSTQPVTESLLLSGTVSESGPAGGSGVATGTIAIDLQAWQGASVNGNRYATSDGSSWQVDYPFLTPPYGPYNVQANLADTVGNVTTTTIGTVSLDGLGPAADVAIGQAITSASMTISGTVSDIPVPVEGQALLLHLEEPSGSTIFADSSRTHIPAICVNPSCPSAGQSGKFGQAIELDGSTQLAVTDQADYFDLTSGDLTIAMWVKSDDWDSGSRIPLLIKGDAVNGDQVNYYFGTRDDGGTQQLSLTYYSNGWIDIVDRSDVDYTNDTWYHLAVTIDAANNRVRFYRDGQLLSEQTTMYSGNPIDFSAKPFVPNNRDLVIGKYVGWDGYSGFDGLIDEVLIYNTLLSANTIYNIANPLDTAVTSAQLRLRHLQEGNLGQNDGTWVNLSLASTVDNFTTWQYTVPGGLEGSYKIDLKATDELGNSSYFPNAWNGDIDLLAPRLTLSYTLISDGYAYVSCYVDDYSSTTDNLVCPGSGPVKMPETAAWFTDFFEPLTRTTALSVPLQAVIPATNTLAACDAFGQCATTSITSPAALAEFSTILTPSHTAHHLGLEPVTISGRVRSPNEVESIEVLVDGQSIYATTFSSGLTETTWTTSDWTPTRWGNYSLEAIMTNGLGQQIADMGDTIITVVAPELVLSKIATPDTLLDSGDALTYTITVSNTGNGEAIDVLVTDTLPVEVSGPDLTTTVSISAFDAISLTIPATVIRAFTPTVTNTGYFSHTYEQGQGGGGFSVCHNRIVTNANDSGPGSLRQAITDACDTALITFSADYAIYLDSTLSLTKELTINGGGHDITISGDSGNDGDRNVQVFDVGSSGVITLANLNVVSGTGNLGGGIHNEGILSVLSSTLRSNISPLSGTGIGGAIYNDRDLTIKHSHIAENEAGRDGGGLYHTDGQLLIERSVISGNISGRHGGGLYLQNVNSSDSRTIQQIALLNNVAATDGGGIFNGNLTTLANSTLAGNQAQDGAAIYNYSTAATLTLNNATVATNTASSGAAVKSDFGGHLDIRNSIIAHNTAATDCSGEGGPFDTISDSLIEDGSCAAPLSGNPLLSALGDFGGPTPSIGLLPGSPALNVGNVATCEAMDQRGVARPIGAACDLGAFESQGFSVTISGGDSQTTALSTVFTQPLTVTVSASVITEPVGVGGIISFTGPISGASLAQPVYTATIGSNGLASVVVTANQVAGTYPVTVTTTGVITPALFSLTNACVSDAYTVTNNHDDGDGSLRRGIANTCANGLITFADSYTIYLNSPLAIDKALTIDHNEQRIILSGDSDNDGSPNVRLFQIDAAAALTMSHLSLVDGIGGILNEGDLTLSHSTLTGHINPAIQNQGRLILATSTLSGNSGHISNTMTLTVTNSTFADSSAAGLDNAGLLTLRNSLIVGSDDSDCLNSGTLVENTNNLIADGSCNPALSGDPLLSALGDYGGHTHTFGLLPGSSALNAGDDATCAATDQRGAAHFGICDIGAFESQGFSLTITAGDNQPSALNESFVNPLEVTVTANVITEPVGAGGVISYIGPASGASIDPAVLTTTTTNAGVAHRFVTANAISGSYVVTATALGAINAVTFSLENYECSNVTVSNANDSGFGSLRQAIALACDGSTITFADDFEVYLDSTLAINKALTINGNGHTITLSGDSGNDGSRNIPPLLIQSGGVVTLTHLNVVSGSQSGIRNEGDLRLFDLLLQDNVTNSGTDGGGAIFSNNTLLVVRSAFIDNESARDSGALATRGLATVVNSTFSGNHAANVGGAIYNQQGTLHSINNTIVNNVADFFASGLYNPSGATLGITNTLIYSNTETSGGINTQCRNFGVLVAGSGNNLIESEIDCAASLSSDPRLGPLDTHGGQTPVHPLLLNSPALDAGDGAACAATPIDNLDQRGESRLTGPGCDIGAFEAQFILTTTDGNDQTTAAGTAFAQPLEVTISGKNGEPLGTSGVISFSGPGLSDTFTGTLNGGNTISATVSANSLRGGHIVTASTAGTLSPAFFTLTNTNVAPVITPTTLSVDEAVPLGTVVGSIEASDDNGDVLSYTISSGNPNGAFAISHTGQITVANLLDYETLSQYQLTVLVSDGLLTDTGVITINLNDRLADLAVTKIVSPTQSSFSQPVTYTLSYHNQGGDVATGVVLTDIIPSEINVLGYQVLSGPAITHTPGITYAWQIGDLAPGQSGSLVISGHIPAALGASTFTNTAQISSTSVESDTLNNQAGAALTHCNDAVSVTQAGNSGVGSLRWAIDTTCDGGLITFTDDFTITLASRLELPKSLTIAGDGQEITISGDNNVQIFHVVAGNVVTLSQLSLANGYANSIGISEGQGGAIQVDSNDAALTVLDSSFSGNNAELGGAIFADYFTPVSVINSTFMNNSAANGGAILTVGPLTVNNSIFTNNVADSNGGAIISEGSPSPPSSISGSLFTNNRAAGGVGGALINDSSLTLTNSTFVSNTVTGDDGGYQGRGGAIFNFGQATINHVTFVSNTATYSGSTLYNAIIETNATMGLRNSLIAGESAIAHCAESLNNNTNNLIIDGSCNPLLTTDPHLSALGDHGGSTATFALLPGSPAIDVGDSATCAATDQRGIVRPVGASCDLGAFESQGFSLTVSGGNNQTTLINTPFAESLMVTLAANDPLEPVANSAVVTFTAPAAGPGLTSPVFTATIDEAGAASVNVAANGIQGSYLVTATTAGATDPAAFSLTNSATYTLSISIVGNGTVSPMGGVYTAGQVIDLSATADSGSLFEGWSGDLSGTTNPIALTMDSYKAITASFALAPTPEWQIYLPLVRR